MKWHKSLGRLKIRVPEREPEAEDDVVHAGDLERTVGLKDVTRRPKPSDVPLAVLSEAPRAIPRVRRPDNLLGANREVLRQHPSGLYPRCEAVSAEVVGEVAPVGRVEYKNIGPVPRRESSDVVQAEDVGRVGRARVQGLGGG